MIPPTFRPPGLAAPSHLIVIEPLEARIAPAVAIGLGDLNGSNGFKLSTLTDNGVTWSVSGAGDVNGDGFDDVIVGVGVRDGDFYGTDPAASYVVFGQASGFAADLNLAALDGTNGFKLTGVYTGYRDELSVGGAGDVNGDGFDDMIVGDARANSGYVIFGKATGFAAALNLSTLDGTNGFKLSTATADLGTTVPVSGAGDVNGDGFDDVIIGAPRDLSRGLVDSSYVVFGRATGFAADLNLDALDGTNGFKFTGTELVSGLLFYIGPLGPSVSGAGDVNGDGLDDFIVGAPFTSLPAYGSGACCVVFGRAGGFAAELTSSTLDGTNGFKLTGEEGIEFTGASVSGAGDVNGDGFDDLLIGAAGRGFAKDSASYVVFGRAGGFAANLELAALDGTNGFKLSAVSKGDCAGYSVSGAGDVNGDGFADLIVGAPFANANGKDSGASYVVFGRASGFAANLELADLDGANGFQFSGASKRDFAGNSVSRAGDVNGDGFADLLIGAYRADLDGGALDAAYVVFGAAGVQLNASTVVVTEADGDIATVTATGGTITPQSITRDADGNIGKIDLGGLAAAQAAGGKAIDLDLGVKIPKGGLGDGKTFVGQIDATGVNLGKITIQGDLGGLFAGTGAGALNLLKVTGDFGKPGQTTEVKAAINTLQVGGDLKGQVIAEHFKKVTVGGNIGNGTLQAAGGIGSLKVAAKIVNSTLKLGTKIGSLLVLSDVENSTVRVKDTLTNLDVRGDVLDSEITVLGKLGVTSAAKAVALQSVKIGGDFVRSKLLAGYDASGVAMNADVSLGPITINGNFEASSIVAGATTGANGFFGDEDDALIAGGGSVVAKIASITIKGSVLGSAALGDHFGLVAEEIGKLKIGGTTQTLTPGPGNDTTPLVLGGTADVKAREVATAI